MIHINKGIWFLLFSFIFFCIVVINQKELSNKVNNTTNLYGVPGILDMPSAGSFDDGQFTFSTSKFGPTLRNTLSFQALPRVFGAFRYTGIGDRPTYYHHSGFTSWDRSFDLRIDVLKEKLPTSSYFGFQDFIGTCNYSAEYIVASK